MAEFVIKLADERGHVQEQVQQAASAEELRARFAQAGYYVYSVKSHGFTSKRKRAKLDTFIIFNQQFLTLIRAGLPILGSLEMLAKSQKNPAFATQLQDVAARVRTGESISTAFEAQGGFPVIYTTTLLAGERSGNLEEVLGRYLQFQRVSLTFRKKLQASLIYPALLMSLVFLLFIFLITFVVPQFAKLYDSVGHEAAVDHAGFARAGYRSAALRVVCRAVAGAAGVGPVPLEQDRGRRGADRCDTHPDADLRQHLAEVPGGAVCPDACRRCCKADCRWCRRWRRRRDPLRAKASRRPSYLRSDA